MSSGTAILLRLGVVCLVLVAISGCGDSSSSDPAVDNNERTVGNPAVISRIENSTSCSYLQREFDIAMDNAEAREPGDPLRDLSMTYANAADNRMGEIGCYG